MRFSIHTRDGQLVIVAGVGPLAGTTLATVDKVAMWGAKLNPAGDGGLAAGTIRASWGIVVSPSVSLNAAMTYDLGIGRPFKSLPHASSGRIGRQGARTYLLSERGAILTGTAYFLEISMQEVHYSL